MTFHHQHFSYREPYQFQRCKIKGIGGTLQDQGSGEARARNERCIEALYYHYLSLFIKVYKRILEKWRTHLHPPRIAWLRQFKGIRGNGAPKSAAGPQRGRTEQMTYSSL
jgi:hypothetical protein